MDKQHLTQATEQLPVELQQRQGQHPHVILSQPPPYVVQVTHDTQQSSSCELSLDLFYVRKLFAKQR